MTEQRASYSAGNDPPKDTAETAADRIKEATENAQQLANKAAEQTRQFANRAQDAAGKVRPFVERSLKEQPMTTLAAAAAVAFVLGALWKR
ncbi:MAG TPA: hypothetical protein VG758_27365 [Hyphomicrobiaceae bacterium]|jgi:ElaB/YqjD/DUF883 family membrane-anchored ribosome-binding protein|nr:hypothetical protein [Hyphomicrobiaceae bacterium]